MTSMFCKYCGKEVPTNSRYCRYCGKKIVTMTKIHETMFFSEKKDINIFTNYLRVIGKYFDFKGRASRREYWLFIAANIVISFGLGFIEGLSNINPESEESIFVTMYQLFITIPSITVGVRRMHDINKSGWFYIVPIYNFIATLIKGDRGENKYGLAPD